MSKIGEGKIETTIEAEEKAAFRTELGYHIFLDRYALKDKSPEKNMQIGDFVVLHNDEEFGASKSLVGVVKQINWTMDRKRAVAVDIEVKDVVHNGVAIGKIDRPLEVRPGQTYRRVADGVAGVEETHLNRSTWAGNFYEMLEQGDFVPGGRILAGMATGSGETSANCYVLPYPEDSKENIFDSIEYLVEIMSKGGGVGYNLSSLRPRQCPVRSVNGRSSGAVSWGELFSKSTGIVIQGGSRRGAGMFELEVWHPDILEFIEAKQTPGRIEFANMSVGITDGFMEAVGRDGWWDLRFPDTSCEEYRTSWTGDIDAWNGPVIVWKTIRARELWEKICESAWRCAEPGVWFKDRAEFWSNSSYYPEGKIVATNPCAEQNLPAWGVCNLGHVYLAKMLRKVDGKWIVDLSKLEKTVRGAVRFLDNAIDAGNYPLEQAKIQQQGERRIGLGTMGLAEMLIKLEIRYGDNEKCVEFVEWLYRHIAEFAYDESANLAREKGTFGFYSPEILARPFLQKLPVELKLKIRDNGLRNVCLLTQAPTGTVGTMHGTSTGIEPFFGFQWTRVGRMGRYQEQLPLVQEYFDAHPDNLELPDYFVHANDITVDDHVAVLNAVQGWVDNSVSKTVNMPNSATVADVQRTYEQMYQMGCKGGTVYRDGCRDKQVLYVDKKEEVGSAGQAVVPDSSVPPAKKVPTPPPFEAHPRRRKATLITQSSFLGDTHVTMSRNQHDEPIEVWVTHGSNGSDLQGMMEAMGKLMSLLLRISSPVPKIMRIQQIISKLIGIGGSGSGGPEEIKSIPSAVARALAEEYWPSVIGKSVEEVENLPAMEPASANSKGSRDVCPSCHSTSYVRQGGACPTCLNCGHSTC